MRAKIHSRPARKRKINIRMGVRQRHTAIVSLGTYQFRAEIGQNGITAIKREGDRKTPAGRFKLLNNYYRSDRRKFLKAKGISSQAVKKDMGWCDDVTHPKYNQPVTLPAKFSHEKLYRNDNLYDFIGVLDANIRPQIKGKGSAIFLHVMRLTSSQIDQGVTNGTAGCLALKFSHLRFLLTRVTSKTQFIFHARY